MKAMIEEKEHVHDNWNAKILESCMDQKSDHCDACKTEKRSNTIFLCWLLVRCSGIKSPLFPAP